MLLAGVLGGMAWAAIPAFLRTRFHTSEILVSLMLVYVAQLLLAYLCTARGAIRQGSTSRNRRRSMKRRMLPLLVEGVRAPTSLSCIALVLAALSWVFAAKTFAGYRMQVAGWRPPRRPMPASARSATSGWRC